MKMNRRRFVQMGVAAATIATTADTSAAVKGKKRFNILYVFSDQHRAISMPGDDVNAVLAPTLESFRQQNMEMANCISNNPLCSPYRAILMSGRYSQQNGVSVNGPGLDPGEHSLGEQFRQNGYHTGYVGKWHLHKGGDKEFIPAGPYRFGFEDWHAWCNTNAHYASYTFDEQGRRMQPKGYNATLMTDQMLEFLEKQKGAEKPWFAVLSWNPPHPPFNPPEEDQEPYDRKKLKLRPNVRFIPEYIKTKADRFPAADETRLQEAMQGYYGGITAIDKEFARLLKALDTNGQSKNTIVIYTCDHGELMGSHGRMAKMCPYEESARVPFYIRIPGAKKAAKSDSLFAAVDIFPTLCGLAGISIPEQCEGNDRSKTLRGESSDGSDQVFLMAETGKLEGAESDLPSYRGIRTKTHTYAVFRDGRWCLYDNIKDPFQMKNLVDDPQHQSLTDEFDKKILAWLDHVKDPFPLKEASAKVTRSYFK